MKGNIRKFIKLFIFTTILFCCNELKAAHILGGEIIYEFIGPGATANTKNYKVTLKLFRNCNSGANTALMPSVVSLSVFDNSNNSRLLNRTGIARSFFDQIQRSNFDCFDISQADQLTFCRQRGFFETFIELPNNIKGYKIVFQTCCREGGLINLNQNFSSLNGAQGSTFFTDVSGTETLPIGNNSSPQFSLNDTSIVCANNPFSFSYPAFDPDGDSLSYNFCNAFQTISQTNSADVVSDIPPYDATSYATGFSGTQPLGILVNINPSNASISGTAPSSIGKYVICICVTEWRAGIAIAFHRKDFIMSVLSCSPLKPELDPTYQLCDTTLVTFFNNGTTPVGATYSWDFGVLTSTTDVSNLPSPTFNYPDTGTYFVKLVMTLPAGCKDSAISPVYVYPGFYPGFVVNGPFCIGSPIIFTDTTKAKYGTINRWKWDFGVLNLTDDTSRLQNPTYTYTAADNYIVSLDVMSSKGCRDTVLVPITINPNPLILAKTNDTLICSIDTLQLNINANLTGNYVWQPNYMISNININNPLVSPDVTTKYLIDFIATNGCKTKDSITVNVLTFITVDINPDTTICRTDLAILKPISQALQYKWTPTTFLDNPNIKNPTTSTTLPFIKYYVTANLGKCQDNDSIIVRTVPYPNGSVRYADTTVCFRGNGILVASGGVTYEWSPTTFLSNPNSAITNVINPTSSITYTVKVNDPMACPKPSIQTIQFNVLPSLNLNAGPDTILVKGQSYLIPSSAIGATSYTWTPATWLSATNIATPITKPQNNITYRVSASSNNGKCVQTDEVNIKVMLIAPGMYVPNAFSPNDDGLNDVVKPLLFGMKSLSYFKVFNRYGELVFQTTQIGKGWDGIYKGINQKQDNFVWVAQGITWEDIKLTQKGNVILVR